MQLVAFGAQDAFLTGNPQVTFFHEKYNRYTNFAMEDIQQPITGVTIGNNSSFQIRIQRNGDLIGDSYVQLFVKSGVFKSSNNIVADSNWIAERAFSDITLLIGGQIIDKHYQTWWRLYSELFMDETAKKLYGKMTTFSGSMTTFNDITPKYTVYLPLLFSFCRNPGLYIPLVALQYSDVTILFNTTSDYLNYFTTDAPVLWTKYVFLDNDERQRFTKGTHEYLIEQLQYTKATVPQNSTELQNVQTPFSFNHPVKCLVWCYQNGTPQTNKNTLWNFSSNTANVQVTCNPQILYNTNFTGSLGTLGSPLFVTGQTSNVYTGDGEFNSNVFPVAPITNVLVEDGHPTKNVEVGPLYQFQLNLNGQNRFYVQYGKYFNQVQPYYHFKSNPYPGIYAYSFAIDATSSKPCGTCNFSRIDNCSLVHWLKRTSTASSSLGCSLFGVNYNILTIKNGMAGVSFSN